MVSLSVPHRHGIGALRHEAIAFGIAGFAVCLVVRLSTLTLINTWEQELLTAHIVQLDWPALLADRLNAADSPLYYALVKALGLAGGSDVALRLPTVFLDSAACGLLALTARRATGRVGALALILIYTLMPVLLRFGQEARPYALLAFFFALAIAAAGVIWRAPRLAVSAFSRGRHTLHVATAGGAIVVSALAMIGAGWTMVLGWLAVASLQASMIAAPRLWRTPGFLRLWLILCAIVWLAILPFILLALPHFDRFLDVAAAVDPPPVSVASVTADLRSVYGWVADFEFNRFFPQDWEAWLAVALLVVAGFGAFDRRARPPIRQAAFVAVAVPAFLHAFNAFASLVVLRYAQPSLWSLCLLYAAGAERLARRTVGLVVLAILAVAVVLQGIDGLEAPRKPSWQPLVDLFANKPSLSAMPGVVTDPTLTYVVDRFAGEGHVAGDIAVADSPRLPQVAGDLLARHPAIWILTGRGATAIARDLPPGAVACWWAVGYHIFVVAARDQATLPADAAGCSIADRPAS